MSRLITYEFCSNRISTYIKTPQITPVFLFLVFPKSVLIPAVSCFSCRSHCFSLHFDGNAVRFTCFNPFTKFQWLVTVYFKFPQKPCNGCKEPQSFPCFPCFNGMSTKLKHNTFLLFSISWTFVTSFIV